MRLVASFGIAIALLCPNMYSERPGELEHVLDHGVELRRALVRVEHELDSGRLVQRKLAVAGGLPKGGVRQDGVLLRRALVLLCLPPLALGSEVLVHLRRDLIGVDGLVEMVDLILAHIDEHVCALPLAVVGRAVVVLYRGPVVDFVHSRVVEDVPRPVGPRPEVCEVMSPSSAPGMHQDAEKFVYGRPVGRHERREVYPLREGKVAADLRHPTRIPIVLEAAQVQV
jgi:hypothetical protein